MSLLLRLARRTGAVQRWMAAGVGAVVLAAGAPALAVNTEPVSGYGSGGSATVLMHTGAEVQDLTVDSAGRVHVLVVREPGAIATVHRLTATGSRADGYWPRSPG